MVNSGVDSNKRVHPILTDTSGRQYVILYDISNVLDTIEDHVTGRTGLITANDAGMNTFTAEYTSNQTNQDIITPSSGRKISIIGGLTCTTASSGEIKLDFPTSNKPIWRHYASKFSEAGAWKINITGQVDEPVRLNTTTGTENVFLMINYREEE